MQTYININEEFLIIHARHLLPFPPPIQSTTTPSAKQASFPILPLLRFLFIRCICFSFAAHKLMLHSNVSSFHICVFFRENAGALNENPCQQQRLQKLKKKKQRENKQKNIGDVI